MLRRFSGQRDRAVCLKRGAGGKIKFPDQGFLQGVNLVEGTRRDAKGRGCWRGR